MAVIRAVTTLSRTQNTEQPTNTDVAIPPKTITGSFDKFVSNELLIARTIMNRDSLNSLSEDQRQRIIKIRDGVNAGVRPERGRTPIPEVVSEYKLMTTNDTNTDRMIQHASIGVSEENVIPEPNTCTDESPNTCTAESWHGPFIGEDLGTSPMNTFEMHHNSDSPTTGSGHSSVDRVAICENEQHKHGIHTKHQGICASISSPAQQVSEFSPSPLSLPMPSHVSNKDCPIIKDESCADNTDCELIERDVNDSIQFKDISSVLCERKECPHQKQGVTKWNVLTCHNAKKEDSYKRIYNEKRRRKKVEV